MSGVTMKLLSNRAPRPRGFSLIESMVALTIGVLLSLGIITVFSAASTTNKTQDALATLQENGRYAATIMSGDLRMLGGQFCSNTSNDKASQSNTAAGWVYQGLSLMSYAKGVTGTNGGFPDGFTDPSGVVVGAPPSGNATAYPISPAVFVQGYACPLGGSCVPTLPSSLPAPLVANNNRVPGSDVLTIRYQSGTGWPYALSGGTKRDGSSCGSAICLDPTINAAGTQTDDTMDFSSGDRALLTTCSQGLVFQVSGVSANGNTMAPDSSNFSGLTLPVGNGKGDPRIFNLSKDFVTISYYLQYRQDTSPNAASGRLIPVLMRTVNGGTPSEIVEGVERLNFSFGVQYQDGTLHYLTADLVEGNSNSTNCSPQPEGMMALETSGCLWRSVQSVQADMLLDSVNNIYTLSDNDVAFRYSFDDINAGVTAANPPFVPPAANAQMTYRGGVTGPANWPAGRMLRREFIAMSAVRNGVH